MDLTVSQCLSQSNGFNYRPAVLNLSKSFLLLSLLPVTCLVHNGREITTRSPRYLHRDLLPLHLERLVVIQTSTCLRDKVIGPLIARHRHWWTCPLRIKLTVSSTHRLLIPAKPPPAKAQLHTPTQLAECIMDDDDMARVEDVAAKLLFCVCPILNSVHDPSFILPEWSDGQPH